MLKGIDHFVIATHNLAATADRYRALGFTVVEGGQHPTGSYNQLIGFADGSYVELLGFYEDSPTHHWWATLHERGGGLIDYCMQTDDIQADYATFKNQGVQMSDLRQLSRVRPDGYKLIWTNNAIHSPHQGLVPFIIEDETPRVERVPVQQTHANAVTGIDTLTFAVADVAPVERIMAAVLGAAGTPVQHDDLRAAGVLFTVGPHRLAYLAPTDADSPLQTWLDDNRPTPYAVSLKTAGQPTLFNLDETDGVRLALVSA